MITQIISKNKEILFFIGRLQTSDLRSIAEFIERNLGKF
nr:MAG TPA: hypothetical protein [Caudoviricetes sp.]